MDRTQQMKSTFVNYILTLHSEVNYECSRTYLANPLKSFQSVSKPHWIRSPIANSGSDCYSSSQMTKQNDMKRPPFSLLNPEKKRRSWKYPIKATSNWIPTRHEKTLFSFPHLRKGSWIGSVCKVKQALLNNLLRTQCCWVFGPQLRPAGGDLKQIFTSLPSSSNTPRQPKDSHSDATWIRTKVRREIFMYGWPAFTFCGVCTFQRLPRQSCNQITGEVECNMRRRRDASAIQSRRSLHNGRIKQCHLKIYCIKNYMGIHRNSSPSFYSRERQNSTRKPENKTKEHRRHYNGFNVFRHLTSAL